MLNGSSRIMNIFICTKGQMIAVLGVAPMANYHPILLYCVFQLIALGFTARNVPLLYYFGSFHQRCF